ncbi:MAG: tyrosine-type recombinase/integrase [Candidatus Sumerlaeaceae bacterium]|nr:tyrosine-type recombinase/integrase [Candidatus Sumerlaeaceae bacterium]
MNEIQTIIRRQNLGRAFSLWLEGKSQLTRDTYLRDWNAMVRWSNGDARSLLCVLCDKEAATEALLAYRAHMIESGLAPATINRRLTAIRSLVRLLGMVGMSTAEPGVVRGVRSRPYRDVRGPSASDIGALVESLRCDASPIGRRTLAAVLLMYECGLRRIEVLRLVLEDLDLPSQTIRVWGKGGSRAEKTAIPISKEAATALQRWLEVRPEVCTDIVFCSLSGQMMSGPALNDSVAKACKKAGLSRRVRPHGLRHAAVSALAHHFGLNDVATFGRWRNATTASYYMDAANDRRPEYTSFLQKTLKGGCNEYE